MELDLRQLRKRPNSYRSVFWTMLGLTILLAGLIFLGGGFFLPLILFVGGFALLHFLLWGWWAAPVADKQTMEQPRPFRNEVPADAMFLPSGEGRSKDGIQCANSADDAVVSHIQAPRNLGGT